MREMKDSGIEWIGDITVQWTKGNSSTWIKVDPAEDGSSASIQLNINHPFLPSPAVPLPLQLQPLPPAADVY